MLSGFRFNINRGIRVGGIMTIYHCGVIHCALELGLLAAKLRYICEMTKGMGKIFLKEVGDGNVKTGLYIKKSQLHL